MRIITTTGFYGTGSSAVTDLVKEYENVSCKSDNEIRILHDPYGISDLEYNLLENPNRHNTSHSIKMFRRTMNLLDHIWFIRRYRKYFDNKFLTEIESYINKITVCEYNAAWHYDVYERGKLFYFISRLYSKINSLLHEMIGVPLDGRCLIPKSEKAYLGIMDEAVFLNATQELMYNLAAILNKEQKEVVMLDQLIPASNINRYIRYVKDVRVTVVDRDPRDVYLLEKEVYRGVVVPCDNVEKFCKWFLWTRKIYYNHEKSDAVLEVQFEDLIYKYDDTVRKIEKHFGLSHTQHTMKNKYFKPDLSIINTQMWKKFTEYDKDMEYISDNLAEYCYDFPDNYYQNRNVRQRDLF